MIEIAKSIRAAWNELFYSRFIRHLETEVIHLREQNQILSTRLEVMRLKQEQPAQPVKRDPPKFKALQTSWELLVAEDMARQDKEAEEQDAVSAQG
jgi:hypothetical protein